MITITKILTTRGTTITTRIIVFDWWIVVKITMHVTLHVGTKKGL